MRVLIADDDRVSRILLAGTLSKWGMETVLAENGTDAWNVLESHDRPSLAILDWMMPGLSGLEVCRRVRNQAPEPYVFIMLLTGRDCSASMVEGLEAGADDYLTKPFKPAELRARLGTARRILSLHRQLIAAREASEFQATFDSLTRIRNRYAVLNALDHELERARRCGTLLAVAIADLDGFKQINDGYGHQVGDAVLREAAGRMTTAVTSGDTVGRYGGEEFLLLLPEVDGAESALAAVDRVRRQLADTPIATAAGDIRVTSSFGVTVVRPEAGTATDVYATAVLAQADRSLYRAKAAGRDRVELATPDASERAA